MFITQVLRYLFGCIDWHLDLLFSLQYTCIDAWMKVERPVAVLIHTYKRGEVSNPLGVSLEAQCLSPNPLSSRFGLLLSRLTPWEAKGGIPYLTILRLIK